MAGVCCESEVELRSQPACHKAAADVFTKLCAWLCMGDAKLSMLTAAVRTAHQCFDQPDTIVLVHTGFYVMGDDPHRPDEPHRMLQTCTVSRVLDYAGKCCKGTSDTPQLARG